MYKIGDFSKITGASIRTLRYYDEIDLFKPDEVDLFTGYRYYSEQKIKEYEIITELKDVGFTLDEIKEHWNRFNDQVMLAKKKQLLNESVLLSDRIKKIDKLRSYITGGKIIIDNNEYLEPPKVKKLSKSDISSINVVKQNYNTFIKYNGEKHINSIIANALNNNDAKYYVIYLNDEFLDDFEVFDEYNNIKNYLRIDFSNNNVFTNEDIMNSVFTVLAYDYSFVTISLKKESKDNIELAYSNNFRLVFNSNDLDNNIILKKDLRKDDYNEK